MDKPEVVQLALAYGAEITSVPFLDFLLTGDRGLVASFIERGADPIANYPFARAFHQLRAKTTIGSYLDCGRIRPDLAEGLQRQADMALRQFAQDGNLKWVSLLMWASADPRSSGPTVEDSDDSEWSTTALHEACGSGNVDVLKRLRPNQRDDLRGMLERAGERANADTLQYLLALGANPNDKPDGGSSALDSCLRILGWEELERVEHGDFAIYEESPEKPSSGRSAIRVLLRHGAVWTPDASSLESTRRIRTSNRTRSTARTTSRMAFCSEPTCTGCSIKATSRSRRSTGSRSVHGSRRTIRTGGRTIRYTGPPCPFPPRRPTRRASTFCDGTTNMCIAQCSPALQGDFGR